MEKDLEALRYQAKIEEYRAQIELAKMQRAEMRTKQLEEKSRQASLRLEIAELEEKIEIATKKSGKRNRKDMEEHKSSSSSNHSVLSESSNSSSSDDSSILSAPPAKKKRQEKVSHKGSAESERKGLTSAASKQSARPSYKKAPRKAETEALKQRLAKHYDIDQPGMRNDQWISTFLRVKAFYMEHGHTRVGYLGSGTPEAFKGQRYMLNWIARQRRAHARNKLLDWRKDLLEEIGMKFSSQEAVAKTKVEALKKRLAKQYKVEDTPLNTQWIKMFLELKAFSEKYGHTDIGSLCGEDLCDQKTLQRWAYKQKYLNSKDKLQNWRKDILCTIGMKFDAQDATVKSKSRSKPGKHVVVTKVSRISKKVHKPATVPYRDWKRMFPKLVAFHRMHGHCRVAGPRSSAKASQLVRWVRDIRGRYKNNDLSNDQVQALNELDFEWNIQNWLDQEWERKRSLLESFKIEHGRFPRKIDGADSIVDGVNLLSWAYTQRHLARIGHLSSERRGRLEEIGFFDSPSQVPEETNEPFVPPLLASFGVVLEWKDEASESFYRATKDIPNNTVLLTQDDLRAGCDQWISYSDKDSSNCQIVEHTDQANNTSEVIQSVRYICQGHFLCLPEKTESEVEKTPAVVVSP